MNVDYDHAQNVHTQAGATAALGYVLAEVRPQTLVDVGCGTGTWLEAALKAGVSHVRGIDGVRVSDDLLRVPRDLIRIVDLIGDWKLEERFDVCLCLEVAEHLEEKYATEFIERLTLMAESIVFSAAVPGQYGQHHVNCQWPQYWQTKFNQLGYWCDDAVRWAMWNDLSVEAWYRQNMFVAHKDISRAGSEPRLRAVIHPELAESCAEGMWRERCAEGMYPVGWYFKLLIKALNQKGQRFYERRFAKGTRTEFERARANSKEDI